MRIFTATMYHETSTFVSRPTTLADFTRHGLYEASPMPDGFAPFGPEPLTRWRERAAARGDVLIEGLFATGGAGGLVTADCFHHLAERLLANLEAASPVDVVMLNLHGAMIADGFPDAEGELLTRVRAFVGADVPVGVELDLHCALTTRMVEQADLVVAYKEWPHVDILECAEALYDRLVAIAERRVLPVAALFDCRLIGAFPTFDEPMRSFVAAMRAAELTPGVVSVSCAHGFPWGDTPEMTARVIVTTNNDLALAKRLAAELGARLFAIRQDAVARAEMSMADAFAAAVAEPRGPVVLADPADNVWAGSPGDATFALAYALEHGIGDVAFGPLVDPLAVDVCRGLTPGTTLTLRIGGKRGPESGAPIDLPVTVRAFVPQMIQQIPTLAIAPNMGDSVWVEGPNRLDVVLVSNPEPTMAPDAFRAIGIDPKAKRVLVCKMWRHGVHGFEDIAARAIIFDGPGAHRLDYAVLPLKRVTGDWWPHADASLERLGGGIVALGPAHRVQSHRHFDTTGKA